MFFSVDMFDFDFELSTLFIFVIGFAYYCLSLWGAHATHPFNDVQPFVLYHDSHDNYNDDGERFFSPTIESNVLSWIYERKIEWVWWATVFDWSNWSSPFWFLWDLTCGLSMQIAWFVHCLLLALALAFYLKIIDLRIFVKNSLRDQDSLLSRAVAVLLVCPCELALFAGAIILQSVANAVSFPLLYAARGTQDKVVPIAQRVVFQPVARVRGILLNVVCHTRSPVANIGSMICTTAVQISGFCCMAFQLLCCGVTVASSALWIAAELLLLVVKLFGRALLRAGAIFFMIGMAIFRPSSFDHQWSARCEKTEFAQDDYTYNHNGYGCSQTNSYKDHCRYECATPQRSTYAATATPLQYQRPSVNDWNYNGYYSHQPTAPYYTYQKTPRYNSYY